MPPRRIRLKLEDMFGAVPCSDHRSGTYGAYPEGLGLAAGPQHKRFRCGVNPTDIVWRVLMLRLMDSVTLDRALQPEDSYDLWRRTYAVVYGQRSLFALCIERTVP